jgi:small-conductance mechanosensitive channel
MFKRFLNCTFINSTFSLVSYLCCFFLGAAVLLKLVIAHEPLLTILEISCWVVVIVSWIAVSLRKLFINWNKYRERNSQEKELDMETRWQDNFPLIFAITIVAIPIFSLFALAAWHSKEYITSFINTKPEYNPVGELGWILIASGFFSISYRTCRN